MADTEITIKNTKAEIMDALEQALKRAETVESGKLNPVKEEKERNEKKAVETAKKAVEQNVFSQELNDKFKDLQLAIATEETRLQELYGVGQELQKLALVMEASRERLVTVDAEMATKENDSNKKIEALSVEFAQKNAELKEEYEAYTKKLKLDRMRESEEYQYNLERERARENNAWTDEKAAREAVLLSSEKQANELLKKAEEKADYILELEEKVENFPKALQSEREFAVIETTEILQREYAHKSALTEKDYQNSVARLEDKLLFLEKDLDSSTKMSVALQNKLDKAYAEIRELATKTVESASGVKIIGNTESKSV